MLSPCQLRIASFERIRSMLCACLAVSVGMAIGGSSSAQAYSADFCNVLVPSYAPPPWYCYSSYTRLSYASARYNGGGCVDYLYAGLTGDGDAYAVGSCTNFANICNYPTISRYGRAQQFEYSGASHTIAGRVDDSPNHTGCF